MKDAISIEDLNRIHQIMETMLVEAKRENWQELMRLDGERRVLLRYKNSDDDSTSETPGKQSSLTISDSTSLSTSTPSEHAVFRERIIELDSQINNMLQQARQSLIDKSRGHKAQLSAKKNYERFIPTTSNSFG